MVYLYLLLLLLLAGFTAYTRNFQRTVVALSEQLDPATGAGVAPRNHVMCTIGVLAGWPAAVGVGMVFVAWWKAMALVVLAFLVLVPVVGSLTPRSMSSHYLDQIRADLERRIARGGPQAEELREFADQIDRLSPSSPA